MSAVGYFLNLLANYLKLAKCFSWIVSFANSSFHFLKGLDVVTLLVFLFVGGVFLFNFNYSFNECYSLVAICLLWVILWSFVSYLFAINILVYLPENHFSLHDLSDLRILRLNFHRRRLQSHILIPPFGLLLDQILQISLLHYFNN